MTESAATAPPAPAPAPAAPGGPPAPAAPDPGAAHRTVIEPARGWELVNVRELWQYRELLLALARRDLQVRYKQTVLGVAWAVVQPAMMMAVFTVFFGRLAGVSTGDVPAPLFFLTGILPWMYFAGAFTGASFSVVGSEHLISKIYFPRLAVPFATVVSATSNFLVSCGLLAAVLLWYGVAPAWNLLLLPVVVLVVAVLATGLGTLFAALNVNYRDVRQLLPFLVQLGMFATPTIYSRPNPAAGETVRWLLILNPMTGLVEAFRASVLGGPVPWAGLGAGAAVAGVAFVVGCLYFRKVEGGFADKI